MNPIAHECCIKTSGKEVFGDAPGTESGAEVRRKRLNYNTSSWSIIFMILDNIHMPQQMGSPPTGSPTYLHPFPTTYYTLSSLPSMMQCFPHDSQSFHRRQQ